MPLIPSVVEPFCSAELGADLVTVGASAITGGLGGDLLHEVFFSIHKNTSPIVEYRQVVDAESSPVVTHGFAASLAASDVLHWEVGALSSSGAESKVRGLNIYKRAVAPDVQIFIGHIGAFRGVIQTEEYDRVIRVSDIASDPSTVLPAGIADDGRAVLLEGIDESGRVIRTSDLKEGQKVVIAKDARGGMTVITLEDYIRTGGAILAEALAAGSGVILADDMLGTQKVIITQDYIQVVGIKMSGAKT